MSYTATELAKKAGVSVCTVNRHLHQELAFATWSRITTKDRRGRNHVHYGWLFSDLEAKRYLAYLESIVGFRSDGTLPSKRIIAMHDSGTTIEEIARQVKTRPAVIKLTIQRAIRRRNKWREQNSSQTAQT